MGAPKAGTSALHAALARHPQIHLTSPAAPHLKEPKYYLCDDVPPPTFAGPATRTAPGVGLAARRVRGAVRGGTAGQRPRGEHAVLPVEYHRPPPDRRGPARGQARRGAPRPDRPRVLELDAPVVGRTGAGPDFLPAFAPRRHGSSAGWAPFWRYRGLGLYGRQLADLYSRVDREQVLLLRYRDLIDEPATTLDRVSAFLGGFDTGVVNRIPPDNHRPYVVPSTRAALLGRAVRTGATLGAFTHPQRWRQLSRPLIRALQADRNAPRPRLGPNRPRAAAGQLRRGHRPAGAGHRSELPGLALAPGPRVVRHPAERPQLSGGRRGSLRLSRRW